MVGCQRGFIPYFKVVPEVLAIRCVIHRHHLVANSLSERLHRSLQLVITAVNRIKSRPLNDRLFRQLCEENGEDFHHLLLHTVVRWLSKGACLSWFYNHFATVLEFFKEDYASLCENLKTFEGDIAYMADLYVKFNEMNLRIQGDELNLTKAKSVISAFVSKPLFYKYNLSREELYNFPNLCEVRNKGQISEEDIEVYWRHLESLHQDFIEWFQDILSLEVPDWITNPFSGVENAEVQLQEELLELQVNEELKPKFKLGYRTFWLQRGISRLYPRLWPIVRKPLISFPSSYLVERGFSVVANEEEKQSANCKSGRSDTSAD
uniref:SCAN domain-containing protein 3 n=1 Tax=Trichuris muris TaxID=70415 RepID=A0A5S6Q6M0_TRIMR